MRAQTPAEFGTAMRWAHVPRCCGSYRLSGLCGSTWGLAGSGWHGRSAACARSRYWLISDGQNLNYREITALRHVPFLGESVAVPESVVNPWSLVGQLSGLVFLIFVVDASITVWRRGDHRKALMVGGSIALFLLAATGEPTLVIWWKSAPSRSF